MPEINHKNHEHHINKPPFYGRKVFEFNKQIEQEAFDMINKIRLFRVGFGYSAKNQDIEKYNEMIKTKALGPPQKYKPVSLWKYPACLSRLLLLGKSPSTADDFNAIWVTK